MDTLKILVLYGGKEATKPRDELLRWLNSYDLYEQIGRKIDARKVADMPANSGNSVHQRVDEAMAWADKAILLVTPDPRGTSGAPNVLEEMGRWLGAKGGYTLAVIRHEDVPEHSNASGLVYIGFKDDVIEECSKKLVRFINDSPQADPRNRPNDPPSGSTVNNNYGTSINIGSVGRDYIAGDKIEGNTTHITGDGNIVGDNNRVQRTVGPSSTSPPSENAGANVPQHAVSASVPELREFLDDKYRLGELKALCFDLEIDGDNLGASKGEFIMNLLLHLRNRGQIDRLISILAKDKDSRLKQFFGSSNVKYSG